MQSKWAPIVLANQNPLEMYPICEGLPKILLPLEGHTFLHILAKHLQASGFFRVTLVVRECDISAIQREAENCPIRFDITAESNNLKFLQRFKGTHLLVMRLTTMTNFNLEGLIERHIYERSDLTLGIDKGIKTSDGWWLEEEGTEEIYGRFQQIQELGIQVDHHALQGRNLTFKRMQDTGVMAIGRILSDSFLLFPGQITTLQEWIDLLINKQKNAHLLKALNLPSIKIVSYQVQHKSFGFRSITDLKSIYFKSATNSKGSYVDNSAEVQSSKIIKSIVMAGVKVGKGCSLTNCLVGPGAVLESGCQLKDCLVGPGCTVPQQSKLSGIQITESESLK